MPRGRLRIGGEVGRLAALEQAESCTSASRSARSAHTASIVRKLRLKSRFEAAIVAHLYADDIKDLETTQRNSA